MDSEMVFYLHLSIIKTFIIANDMAFLPLPVPIVSVY